MIAQIEFQSSLTSSGQCAVTFNNVPQAGDVLVAQANEQGQHPTTQAGWTTLGQAGPEGVKFAYKIAGASEPARQVPFSCISGSGIRLGVWLLRGVDTSHPINVSAFAVRLPNQNSVSVSLTSTASNGYAVGGANAGQSGTGQRDPAAWTNDLTSIGNPIPSIFGHRQSFPTGAQTVTWTFSTTPNAPAAGVVVLNPSTSTPASVNLGGALRIQAPGSKVRTASLRIAGGLPFNLGASLTISAPHPVTQSLGSSLRVAGGLPYNVGGSLRVQANSKVSRGASLRIAAPAHPTLPIDFTIETAMALTFQLP